MSHKAEEHRMRIKIVVIDLEIPPRVKRWALRLAIPAVILGLAGVAFASLPHTFASGEVLTAASLNADFQNLDGRVSTLETGRTIGASVVYTSATPSYSLGTQVPTGWAYQPTGSLGGDSLLTFPSPFSGVPVCTVSIGNSDQVVPVIINVTATSVEVFCQQATCWTTCVGPE
jgi:hypothetical protein